MSNSKQTPLQKPYDVFSCRSPIDQTSYSFRRNRKKYFTKIYIIKNFYIGQFLKIIIYKRGETILFDDLNKHFFSVKESTSFSDSHFFRPKVLFYQQNSGEKSNKVQQMVTFYDEIISDKIRKNKCHLTIRI